MPERTHINDSPEQITVEAREQDPLWEGHMKPKGFWYEVGADWRRWCQEEGYDLHRFAHLHRVELGDTNVLVLDTLTKLDAFHERFIRAYRGGDYVKDIEWAEVARHYDGVEIAPYQWARRLEIGWTWYYGWDCASGVIWRPRGVTVTYDGPVELKGLVL